MIDYSFMDKDKAPGLMPELFAILSENMSAIAPTGNTYDEDFAIWSSNVGPALEKENRQVVLILDDGAIVGYVQYYTNETTFMIEEAQLKSAFQGCGVMRKAFAFIADNIPRDLLYAEAFANKLNLRSQNILTHLGFSNIGENKNGRCFHYRADCRSLLRHIRIANMDDDANEADILNAYYEVYDEEGRLLSKHGQVEYITTQKYIHACAEKVNAKRLLEVGAGTGRYSVQLAKEGFDVTAVELVEHNLQLLRQKLDGSETITAVQGNATDLSRFPDGGFDITMLLGPMYHLFTFEDKQQALAEAVRVTKPGGYILVSYCMNEPTVVQFVFQKDHLREILETELLTADWHCGSDPKQVFELARTEDIAALDATVDAVREKLVATDGATNYMREFIDAADDYTFSKWVEYHLATCERQDLIGASHHVLDILQKN